MYLRLKQKVFWEKQRSELLSSHWLYQKVVIIFLNSYLKIQWLFFCTYLFWIFIGGQYFCQTCKCLQEHFITLCLRAPYVALQIFECNVRSVTSQMFVGSCKGTGWFLIKPCMAFLLYRYTLAVTPVYKHAKRKGTKCRAGGPTVTREVTWVKA